VFSGATRREGATREDRRRVEIFTKRFEEMHVNIYADLRADP
jgi:hypothetical protein